MNDSLHTILEGDTNTLRGKTGDIKTTKNKVHKNLNM